ncbi:MAG TPA: iron-containing redox enzyme family protein [Acidimicrobiales bacterium]|nr:iron-containing redox enzyme family protein [Acidimicrobiales bacterium]
MKMTALQFRLRAALDNEAFDNLQYVDPQNDRDALLTLLDIYELWLAPLDTVGDQARFQNQPAITALKWRLEEWLVDYLDSRVGRPNLELGDVADAIRRIARQAHDSIYDWIATSADWDQLVTFLAIEGGPDGGFDDLVAVAQVGLKGEPKVVLGANYWDEMGRGDPDGVHTTLHDRLVEAVGLQAPNVNELPTSALYRSALNGLLATNRHLQPEMLGALGLLELQAGQRCRRVLDALHRLGAPKDAYPFYEEHASTDPRHGKEWLEAALRPLVAEHPEWAQGMIRGARWRADVNARLFRDLHTLVATRELQPA